MARNSTGKWVQRAASTGGGRTYRGQRPTNWYAALVVICLLGLLSVMWARYERQHPTTTTKPQPRVGQTWFTAMGADICGKVQAPLPASPASSATGMTADGSGVIVIAPKTSSQAGDNAVLGQFISGYKGLTLTATSLGYPGQKTLHNGDKCPKGTPDAGKSGTVQVAYWPTTSTALKDFTAVSDPATLKPADLSELTMNFLPTGSAVKKPPASALLAMLKANTEAATSTTTSVPTTATVPSTTPTTGTTATTAPVTTTTSGTASTTTTTKP